MIPKPVITLTNSTNRISGILLILCILLLSQKSIGQCIEPLSDCAVATILCETDECYETTNIPVSCCQGFCGINTIINNPQYLLIIPTCEDLTITIEVGSCSGQGLQAAIINSCDFTGPNEVLDCNPGTGQGGTMTLSATVTPGIPYWLLIDGSNGAVCEYYITTTTCNTPPELIGEVDSLVIADTSLCVGDTLESVLYHTVENYSSFFFVGSWDGDTILTNSAIHEFVIPDNIDPGIYSVCRGIINLCEGEAVFACGTIEIGGYVQGTTFDTTVCLLPGATVFVFNGVEYTQSGEYEIITPSIDNESCDTINYLILTLQIDRFAFNEFQVNNIHFTDEASDYDSWFELKNTSNFSQDLSGYYISDDSNDLTKWSVPSGTIVPQNGFITFWADGEESEGAYHTNFSLSQDGGTLFLSSPCEGMYDHADYIAYKPGVTHARFPDVAGDFIQRIPSFGSTNFFNNQSQGVLNEILAINQNDTIDEAGDRDPWLEIFNVHADTNTLYGSYISDDDNNPAKFLITDPQPFEPGEYRIFWIDNEPEEGDNHLNFLITGNFPYLRLYNSLLQPIDQMTFGVQTPDTALARVPNGHGGWVNQRTTFKYSNDLISGTNTIRYPDIIIAPNPATDQLFISNLPDHEVTFTISDLHGRILNAGTIVPNTPISINALSSGLYFIHISGEGLESRKFVKQ